MPGKISISETTYELVKDKFSCDYRGELEAKGKGVMKMYLFAEQLIVNGEQRTVYDHKSTIHHQLLTDL